MIESILGDGVVVFGVSRATTFSDVEPGLYCKMCAVEVVAAVVS